MPFSSNLNSILILKAYSKHSKVKVFNINFHSLVTVKSLTKNASQIINDQCRSISILYLNHTLFTSIHLHTIGICATGATIPPINKYTIFTNLLLQTTV